jgi:hypothetical protein
MYDIDGPSRYTQPAPPPPATPEPNQPEIQAARTARARADGGPNAPRGAEQPHSIRKGETLSRIAEQNHQSVEQLIANNRHVSNPDLLAVNQTIFIPMSAPAPQPPYEPKYDPATQPDLALRAETMARLLGGPSNGTVHLTPEEMHGVATNQLAEQLAGGNPIEQSVYANLYGGKDSLTQTDLKPLWERMGISREALRKTLVEAPWKASSYHLGRELSQEDYARLQKIEGPLGHLLNRGVDPRTALNVQATWSAHFYGGYDPITQQRLAPVWERWGMSSPTQLQQMLGNDPAAGITLADLTGGTNPLTGTTAPPPWQNSSDAFGEQNLGTAQNILGIQVTTLNTGGVPAEQWEPYALSVTSSSAYQHMSYQNPLGLAQSPAIRNGPQFQAPKKVQPWLQASVILTALMDPLGGYGMFGLLKGGRGPGAPGSAGTAGNSRPPGLPPHYQIHGMLQVFPDGAQDSLVLLKGQRVPRFSDGQLAANEQRLRESQRAHLISQGVAPAEAERRATELAQSETRRQQASRFVKGLGGWSDGGGNLMLFFGKADETGGSRGRRPAVVGVDWSTAQDGSLERFGGMLGGPVAGMPSYWNAAGLQFQMGKSNSGEWVPTGFGALAEWGQRRFQIYPAVYWDPDTHKPNGLNISGGTGYHLAQFGVQQRDGRPFMDLNMTADPNANGGLGSHVTYSSSSSNSISFGYMGGANGKALGFAIDRTEQKEAKAFVHIGPEGLERAKENALKLQGQVADGKAPHWTALDAGTGVSSSEREQNTMRAMAFFKLVTAGGSKGDSLLTNKQVVRTDEKTWTVSSYSESQDEYSAHLGLMGIGPGSAWWHAGMQGETFRATANVPAGPDGKPQLDAATQAAVDQYLTEGLFPNAAGMEGRFQGKQAEQYQRLRAQFVEARTRRSTKPNDHNAGEKYATAREELNQFCRETLQPGAQIMPGLELSQVASRKTDGQSKSFIVWKFGSRETVNGQIKYPDRTTNTYALTRDWRGRPEVEQGLVTDKVNAGPDFFTLSTRSEVKRNPPAATAVPVGLPYDVVKGVSNINGYEPLLEAYDVGRDVNVSGELKISLSSQQLMEIGDDLSTGPRSAELWRSFAARTSGLFQDLGKKGDFFDRNPEYVNNAHLGTGVNASQVKYIRDSYHGGKDYGLTIDDRLIDKFAATTSPAEFRKLSEGERRLFTDIVRSTASGEHSPYETLALVGARTSDAPDAPPLLTEEQRTAQFEKTVKSFEDLQFTTGNMDDESPPKSPDAWESPAARIYAEPTAELVHFVRGRLSKSDLIGSILNQSSFDANLPKVISSAMGKTNEQLKTDLLMSTAANWMSQLPPPLAGPKGMPPEHPVRSSVPQVSRYVVASMASPGALIVLASREGSSSAWQAVNERNINVEDVFRRLSDSSTDQITRQALIHALRPGASAEQKTVLDSQQRKVDTWRNG